MEKYSSPKWKEQCMGIMHRKGDSSKMKGTMQYSN